MGNPFDETHAARRGWRRAAGALALGLGAAAAPALAADDDKAVAATLRQLAQRLQQLEQRNAELERQVKALQPPAVTAAPAAPPAAGTWGAARDARLDQLERQGQKLQQRVDDLGRAAEPVETAPDEGAVIEASVVAVAQRVNAAGSADGRRQSRLNYRGDLTIGLPGGAIGEAQGTAFAHLRLGQGTGVALRPTHSSTVNSVGFETAAGPDDSFAILAQAYYQLEWSLTPGGFNDQKGRRVELTAGKIDVFGFFDQNAVAGDEAAQFLNNAFVHNPLLDSGGDIGADAYGFAPGARLGYFDTSGAWAWGASLGVFGAGSGANLSGSLGKPFNIVQIELSPMQINGEPRGSYRVYAWTNGRTSDLDGNAQRHTGIGVSADQRIGRDWNLFGRWGRRSSGDAAFDRALTLGLEHGGRAWGRGRDAVGAAIGWLRTGTAWQAATADTTLAGYAASGDERIAELYYRMRLNEHLELSPDFQFIQRAGGDGLAPSVRVFGVRASFAF
jgi:hypothetical protein